MDIRLLNRRFIQFLLLAASASTAIFYFLDRNSPNVLFLIILAVILGFSYFANEKGHTVFSSFLLTFGIWIFLTVLLLAGEQGHAYIPTFFVLLPYANLVLGFRGLLIFGGLSTASIAAFYFFPNIIPVAAKILAQSPTLSVSIWVVVLVVFDYILKVENSELKKSLAKSQELSNTLQADKLELNIQFTRLQALKEIDDAILSGTNIDHTLKELIRIIRDSLSVDAVTIFIMPEESNVITERFSVGYKSKLTSGRTLRLGEGVAGRIALNREPMEITDVGDLLSIANHQLLTLIKDEGFKYYYARPLETKGNVIGVIELFSRSHLKPDLDWKSFFESLSKQTSIAIDNAMLFDAIRKSNRKLSITYDSTLESWAKTLELRDFETAGHSSRVTDLTMRFALALNDSSIDLVQIRHGALLHDIGKMGIPDKILLKPGRLTDEEFEIMKQHVRIAEELLIDNEFLRPSLDIPRYHHEKWDGTGYLSGLSKTAIPLPARLFAIVDVWDALTSDRSYRKAWSKSQTLDYIKSESSKHFDPDLTTIFVNLINS